jgi:hypothetical protein
MQGPLQAQDKRLQQDFRLLDLTTNRTKLLTRLTRHATMRTFDVTSDGKHIVFDRLEDNSDIVLIDLPKQQAH